MQQMTHAFLARISIVMHQRKAVRMQDITGALAGIYALIQNSALERNIPACSVCVIMKKSAQQMTNADGENLQKLCCF